MVLGGLWARLGLARTQRFTSMMKQRQTRKLARQAVVVSHINNPITQTRRDPGLSPQSLSRHIEGLRVASLPKTRHYHPRLSSYPLAPRHWTFAQIFKLFQSDEVTRPTFPSTKRTIRDKSSSFHGIQFGFKKGCGRREA